MDFFCFFSETFFFLFISLQEYSLCVFAFTSDQSDQPCSQSLISPLCVTYYALSRNSVALKVLSSLMKAAAV